MIWRTLRMLRQENEALRKELAELLDEIGLSRDQPAIEHKLRFLKPREITNLGPLASFLQCEHCGGRIEKVDIGPGFEYVAVFVHSTRANGMVWVHRECERFVNDV